MVFMMPLSVVVNTLFHLNNMIMFTWARLTGAGIDLHIRRVRKVGASTRRWLCCARAYVCARVKTWPSPNANFSVEHWS